MILLLIVLLSYFQETSLDDAVHVCRIEIIRDEWRQHVVDEWDCICCVLADDEDYFDPVFVNVCLNNSDDIENLEDCGHVGLIIIEEEEF